MAVYVLIFLVVWCFVLPIGLKKRLQNAFFYSQVPVFHLVENLKNLQISSAFLSYSKEDLLENIRDLIKENAYLKMKLFEQNDQIDFAQKILKLEKISVGENFKLVAARVIHRSLEAWSQWVVIDKGSKDGIKVGQGVICVNGVVGRIKEVKNNMSFVELITNSTFKLLVKMESGGEHKVLQGVEQGNCFIHKCFKAKLLGMRLEDDFLCPQRIETDYLGQQFPNHLYVGNLLKVKKDGNEPVGIVELGNYLFYLHEVGVLIPTSLQ